MRIVVGLSGGVDSAVAAHLLLEQGHQVVGIFMRNWHDESVTINNECPWIDDSNDAMLAAEHLGIPFQVLDLSGAYYQRIVEYMFAEYRAGRTPNPDVLCNREIKFDVFLSAALNLQADAIATGHYARKNSLTSKDGACIYRLLAGADPEKDQSYFLCQLNQAQLARVVFPIGHLRKAEVRAIARKIGLPNASKKDSQGLCFVGKVKLPVFLQQRLAPRLGDIIEIEPSEVHIPVECAVDTQAANENLMELTAAQRYTPGMGKKVGVHQGVHNYTIGQRKGLGVGGKATPLFIIDTDAESNTVYVGMGENHPGLYRKGLFIGKDDVHWVRPDLALTAGGEATYMARIRYRQALSPCKAYMRNEGLYLVFEEPQRGIARGQFAAWYIADEVIGSGVID